MTESPYASPNTRNTSRSVVITDASAFEMPHKCVICSRDVSKLLSYTQDHLPLIGPGFGFMRTTNVSVPYCEEHSAAFQQRFKRLRVVQRIVYASLLLCAFTIFFEPVRLWLGWDPKPGIVSGVFCVILFIFLVVTVFCIKPFLYDVFVNRCRDRIRIKSRSPQFIEHVVEANRSIVR